MRRMGRQKEGVGGAGKMDYLGTDLQLHCQENNQAKGQRKSQKT